MSPAEASLPGRASVNFYHDLPPLTSFAEATEGRLHVDLPHDWWIVIADVAGSTQAIEAGAYKKVNTVGVACIAAVTNVDRAIDLPFVFGGDGATFAIPEMLRERVISALRGAQRLALASFGLDLRVGLVQVSELTKQGYWVKLAKVRLSPHVTQPALSGRGWEEAEKRVKQYGMPGALKVVETEGPALANFEGFECRWQGVPSFYDHKLSLLVAAISPDADTNLATYQRLLQHIQEIYGDVEHYHPLCSRRMRLTFDPRLLAHEWRVRSAGTGWRKRCAYLMRMLLQNLAGRILFARNMDTASVKWSRYRDELVQNSDFRKFDGMLRMIMDGSESQAASLQAFLEEEYRERRLVYGIQKSREALVTCIVQSYTGNHLHFVDGSDGGYALAARELKRRLLEVLGEK
ncbi:MAG: DUF3095 domain-containing protein [Methylophilaceae bacterium]|nr:DUF3095 domain-containing protein [Methylophilaceae bacterium]